MPDRWLQDDEHSPVMLVDGTVRRRPRWWTESVHHLMSYLTESGFAACPRPLGFDPQGRETLTSLEGDSGRVAGRRVSSLIALAAFASFLREFHDAVVDYVPPADADWALPRTTDAPPTGMCHGDFAPWNVVWSGETPVGILDFDLAHRARSEDDVAYALAYSVPFRNDEDTKRMLAVDEVPDRRERITVFADAYGIPVEGLVDRVVARQWKYVHDVEHLRHRGLVTRWTSTESIAQGHEIASWVDEHRSLFEPT
jgi:hypothetical protein